MSDDVARWLDALAARGITFTVRNGRLRCHPDRAYGTLADDEIIFLRHHRADIRTLINNGHIPHNAGPSVVEGKATAALNATFEPALKETPDATAPTQSLCACCGQLAEGCASLRQTNRRRWEALHRIDPQHAESIELEQTERQQRIAEEEFQQLLKTIGRSYGG
ncbi:MAG TPA: hypothetical protein VM165_16670 [Planctomycetaceae bacterium]|nr:hypothetical protein [Planctomycetaceae bacterium]